MAFRSSSFYKSVLDRLAASEGSINDLSPRLTALETYAGSSGTLAGRMAALENGPGSFTTWKSNKASTITPVDADPTTVATVSVAGISVIAGSSATSVNTFNTQVKTRINAIISALKSRDIMA